MPAPANTIAPASATHLAQDWAPFRLWIASRDQRPRPVRFPGEMRRIMVGVDFSPASDTAMGVVFAIAATTGTVVDLVHVFDGFTEGLVLGNWPLLDQVDAVLARIDRALRARATAAAVGRRALRGDQPGRRARYRADPARAPHRRRSAGAGRRSRQPRPVRPRVERRRRRASATHRRLASAHAGVARFVLTPPVRTCPRRRGCRSCEPPSQLGAPTVPVPG